MDYKTIITFWKEFKLPQLFNRLIDINLDLDFITAITGPRRAGKSFFCFQLIKNLIDKGIPKDNILYINFEDNRLIGANSDDLERLLETFFELYNISKNNKIYLFFDEIQAVTNWDSWVRKIYDIRKDIKLILTGSSSKLLSREVSTKLRGRVLNKEIFPFSFKEVLSLNKIKYDLKTVSYSQDKSEIMKHFSSFILNGGYPAIVIGVINEKDMILQSYYESIILKDIVERHKIEDVKKLTLVLNLLSESASKEISYTKIANKLSSAGIKIIANTVLEYISYFEEAYLFFQNLKYEYSLTKQIGSIKKIYCIDNGLLNILKFRFSDDFGRLLENIVFIELKRRNKTIYYNKEKYECDFIIQEKSKIVSLIQVTEKITDENKKREIKGLLEAMKKFDLNKGLILTYDEERDIKIKNKEIKVIPVWKWMLLNSD